MSEFNSISLRRNIVETALVQNPREVVLVSVELWANLATVLVSLMGSSGFSTLYRRNLRLVAQRFPSLAQSLTDRDADDRFDELRKNLSELDSLTATVASLALLDSFLGLLSELVGEAITYKVLTQAWPDRLLPTIEKDTLK